MAYDRTPVKINLCFDVHMTADEVAAALGVTRRVVQFHEANGIRKARAFFAERGIRLVDLVDVAGPVPAHQA